MFVSSEAAEAVFSWREAIEALAESYAAPAPPTAIPPRTVAGDDGAWLRSLPALPAGRRYFGGARRSLERSTSSCCSTARAAALRRSSTVIA
jgi:ornithine cyclodeaminase/alanine dehydrogenase